MKFLEEFLFIELAPSLRVVHRQPRGLLFRCTSFELR